MERSGGVRVKELVRCECFGVCSWLLGWAEWNGAGRSLVGGLWLSLLGLPELLFQVLDLVCLGGGGILEFVLDDLHELIGDGLSSLCDGWPGGVWMVGLVKEGAQVFEVNASCKDGLSEGVEESGHGGGLKEHGLDLDPL